MAIQDQSEEDYKKELAAAGVEIPEDTPPEESTVEEPKVETPEEPKQEPKKEEEPEKPEEVIERKRSIYHDLKEKKHELRSEREAREQVEQERDELRRRLEEIQGANGSDAEKSKDVVKYAEEVGADPVLVQRIIEEARAGVKAEIPEDLKNGLEEFKSWKQQNAELMDKQLFEKEFVQAIPSIQQMFPNATQEEITAMKSELDKLSHSKEMHDKELDYVVFKNRAHLESFVSPKKRGIESRGRIDSDDNSTEFNPNVDFSKMSPAQLETWEKTYAKAVEQDRERTTMSGGRKVIL